MKLSEHFDLDEFEHSGIALARGIDNTAPPNVLRNLVVLAAALEEVRALLGHPINISSGYRCACLNQAVKGAVNSAHMSGYAADFTCDSFGTPLDVVRAIVDSDIKFDQCIEEGHWVHFSVDPQMRQRILTAHFDAKGNVTYTQGVA